MAASEIDRINMTPSRNQYSWRPGKDWSREDFVELLEKVLKTEIDLSFLLELDTGGLEVLVARIRNRINQAENNA